MKYSEGKIGRTFVLKFEHGDDLLSELKKFAAEKKIKAGLVHFIGALNNAEIVVGPKKNVLPPDAVWRKFSDGREMVGTGTIFWKGGEPGVHIHSAIGRGDKVNVGCIRKGTKVYLVVEAVVMEIKGADARRSKDARSGMELLDVGGGKTRRKGG
jgi:predicted DNA-binding protein with PD1-like motif